MRGLFACAFALSVAIASAAQTSPVQVLKQSWEKSRIDWYQDPLSTPSGENIYDLRRRVSTERRQRSALEERTEKAINEEKKKPTKPPRYVFIYNLAIQNLGEKVIKEIDWDYVFTDAATGEVLGRREFTSVESIKPGKRKDLKITASSAPTQRVSVHSLGKNEHDGIAEKIEIQRILYEDKSEWVAAKP